MAKVLVVDDIEDNVKLLKYDLEDDGYTVVTAADGLEALAVAQDEMPDVILMDVMMPRLDGIEACRILKQDTRLAHIPVLILSAKDRDADIVAGLDVGAQDYIPKPINYAVVAARLRSALRIKQYEDSIREERDRAEKALRARSAFLAMMSHEIRTPITAIMGLSEILAHEDRVAPFDAKQASQTIYANSRYLLDVINNILDHSKMESGNLEVDCVDCSLFEILRDVEALVNLKAVEKDLLFLVDYEYPLPQRIHTDPTRLKQVLVNLVSNAIKFTEKGSVRVRSHFNQTLNCLEISVIDTGIGISAEGMQSLFQPFKQADPSINRRFGGTGLGMSISSEIVKKLGGEISVQSSPGNGTTFRLNLPLKLERDAKMVQENPLLKIAPETTPQRRFSGRVLVVEDEKVNQRLFAHILTKAGLEVEIAGDGQSAVDKATSETFDLILMDMNLPVLDGPAATSLLRQGGLSVPIVALTASQDLGDIEKCLHAGCVEYLPKPFQRDELYDCLGRYVVAAEQAQIEQIEDGPPALPDDQRFMQLVLGYSRKLPGRLRDIEDYAARQEWKALREAAHIMAGAGIFGFNKVAFVAKLLEEKAQMKNQKACAELLGRLREEIAKVSDLKKDK